MIIKNYIKVFNINFIFFHFLIWFVKSETISESNNESDLLNNIPPIYKMDDFDDCKSKNKSYCFAKIRLSAQPNYSQLWTTLIHNLTESKCLLTPEIIERGLCIDKTIKNVNNEKQFAYINEFLKKEIKTTYLKVDTYYLRCQDNYATNLSNFDYFIVLLAAFYFGFVLLATLSDYYLPIHFKTASVFQILSCFSLIYNWKKFINCNNRDKNCNDLKFLDGIRTLNCLAILMHHAIINTPLLYIDEDIVQIFQIQALNKIFNPFFFRTHVLYVQSFFFIAHFLNAFQMLKFAQNSSNKITFSYLVKRIGKRIFRFLPHLLVLTLFANSNILKKLSLAPDNDWSYFNRYYCIQNWWLMFLFISNEFRINEMCHPVGWYLSADIQLYIISTMTMYLTIKFKLGVKFLMVLLLLVIITHGLYLNYLPAMIVSYFQPNVKVDGIFNKDIYYFHISTISSLASVFAGQLYGLKYYKEYFNNAANLDQNTNSRLWTFFIIGPILFGSIALSLLQIGKLQNTISLVIYKPLYCLSLGNFILGIASNIGMKLKYLLETKFMLLAAKLSFCVYFYQGFCSFFVRFKQPIGMASLQAESNKNLFIVVGLSTIMYFAVDQPVQNLIQVMINNKKKTS